MVEYKRRLPTVIFHNSQFPQFNIESQENSEYSFIHNFVNKLSCQLLGNSLAYFLLSHTNCLAISEQFDMVVSLCNLPLNRLFQFFKNHQKMMKPIAVIATVISFLPYTINGNCLLTDGRWIEETNAINCADSATGKNFRVEIAISKFQDYASVAVRV